MFYGRIFKLDKAAALTDKDHRKIVQTRQHIAKGRGEEAQHGNHQISGEKYNDHIDTGSKKSF